MSQVVVMQDSNQQFNNRPDKPHSRRNKPSGRATAAQGRSGSENTSASTASSVVPSASTEAAGSSLIGPSNGNVGITGGEFNAAGRDRINITNIIDGGPGYRGRRNGVRPGRPRRTNKSSTPDQDENVHKVENVTKKESIVNVNEVASEAPRIPERKSCDIYYQHLAPKGRGSPLYIPGPNQNLPEEYQRTGMRIGDVGILTEHGYFDFLFNICHPADHPINYDGVPDNFERLLIKPTDIQKHLVFDEESYIASASIKKSYPEGDSCGLKFKSSACEGAVLTMPLGSTSEDVGNQERFRRYLETHTKDWYRYVKIVRERCAGNGDVRLVTGYDKASLWGMAIFSDSAAKEDSLLLEFQPVTETNAGKMYKWKHSGSAEVRSGPGAREVEDLRRGDPDPERKTYQNQDLFVRTLNATLQENDWRKLAAEFGEVEVDGGTFTDDASSPQSSRQRSMGSSRTSPHPTSRSSANAPGGRTALATINNIPVNGAMRLAPVSPRETTLAYHPSDVINKMLLKLNPSARVAITHDEDWISVLRRDDFVLPSAEQLCARIKESLVVRQDKGVVFLEKPEYATHSLDIDNDINEGIGVSSAILKIEPTSSAYESDDLVDLTLTGQDGINLPTQCPQSIVVDWLDDDDDDDDDETQKYYQNNFGGITQQHEAWRMPRNGGCKPLTHLYPPPLLPLVGFPNSLGSGFEGGTIFTSCVELAEAAEAVQRQSPPPPHQLGGISAFPPQAPSPEIDIIGANISLPFRRSKRVFFAQHQIISDLAFPHLDPRQRDPLPGSSNCSSPVSQYRAFDYDEPALQMPSELPGLENFYGKLPSLQDDAAVDSPREPPLLTPSICEWYHRLLICGPLGLQLPPTVSPWSDLRSHLMSLGLDAGRASGSSVNSPHLPMDQPEWICMHGNHQNDCCGPTTGYSGGFPVSSVSSPASSINKISPDPQERQPSFIEAFDAQLRQPPENRLFASLAASHRRRERAAAFCQICNHKKGFMTKYNISDHDLIHRDVKGHRCDICGHEFRTRSILIRRHRRKNQKCKLAKSLGKSYTDKVLES